MVVVGQPKTASEYIQTTIRVGQESKRPVLAVTLLNTHKPRDRSHYERSMHSPETFYRAVEVASVPPFAARAMDRGLGGALVALARHAEDGMTPPAGAGRIRDFRASLHRLATDVFRDRVTGQPTLSDDEDRDAQPKSVCNRSTASWMAGLRSPLASAPGAISATGNSRIAPGQTRSCCTAVSKDSPKFWQVRASERTGPCGMSSQRSNLHTWSLEHGR